MILKLKKYVIKFMKLKIIILKNKMRYLITGGAGFIGSHLAEQLVKSKYKVIILDNLAVGNKKNLKILSKVQFKKLISAILTN